MPGPVIWSGHITFGLVTVPVSLISAVERGGTPLHLVHMAGDCYGRIRYRKVCEIEDREVPEHDIGRGYETADGSIVPISDTDLDHLPLATAHAIELLGTLPAEAIDPRQIGAASYYLAASTAPAAVRPYVLLVEALARRSQVVIVKFAVRGDRERLGMLRARQGALVLNALRWSDEIRPPAGVAPSPAEVDEEELAAALDLIEARSVDTLAEIADLTDHYAQALDAVVEAKLHARDLTRPAESTRGPHPVDLMDMLQQSVRDAHANRGGA
ncbi:Ku protein [Streptomyces sp. NPDC048523]|uniref:non-homologous end joining protein Ku n=1 Tax=Streptomyces sp. NPDC048523 TaxID=3365567 RepID=UPI003711F326